MAGREASRNRERLEYKFITEYVRNIHKDIYDQAYSFYKTVKENNLQVHDLTKTVEFMERAKPNECIPRYYHNRRGRTTARKQTELSMTLNIPLMTIPTVPSPVAVPPTEEPLPLTVPPVEPLPLAVPPTEEPLPLTVPPVEPLPLTVPPVEPLPLLEEETFQQLMQEINQDPDLHAVFNNIQSPESDDEGMNPQVWDDLTQVHTPSMEIS